MEHVPTNKGSNISCAVPLWSCLAFSDVYETMNPCKHNSDFQSTTLVQWTRESCWLSHSLLDGVTIKKLSHFTKKLGQYFTVVDCYFAVFAHIMSSSVRDNRIRSINMRIKKGLMEIMNSSDEIEIRHDVNEMIESAVPLYTYFYNKTPDLYSEPEVSIPIFRNHIQVSLSAFVICSSVKIFTRLTHWLQTYLIRYSSKPAKSMVYLSLSSTMTTLD